VSGKPTTPGAGDPAEPQAPGRHALGDTIDAFDLRADQLLERVRGNPVADAVFVAASALGDFSLIWHLVGGVRGLTTEERAQEAFELAALLGVESLLVNQGVKRLFRRTRPTETGDARYEVRKPSTSSFPSGHASAGFFAATVLTSMSGRRMAPIWYGLAAVVALSRPYVRIHHASDVLGGAALGLALGKIAVAGRNRARASHG
jgi:membrane-associated phospholipid phosphatase